MEFSELNDHICADSWLIKSEEISKRKLIRQTPQYNIYKADYFGDALVYEPVCGHSNFGRQLASDSRRERQERVDNVELSARLSGLNLNLNNFSNYSSSRETSSYGGDGDQTDSAYSSISSTPQYHTKNVNSEFQFPDKLSRWTSSSSVERESNSECKSDLVEAARSSFSGDGRRKQCSTLPLILNLGSYQIESERCLPDENEQAPPGREASYSQTSSDWLNELNELRLVAHESFMLFMGFSLKNQDSGDIFQTTSLVMEHPKATSLYNLLHATYFATSPSDRFFAPIRQAAFGPNQRLKLANKLNICQQVTNAMTYLHDKNIVHGRLTSVNIYIELNQRVKISLIDNDEQAIASRTTKSSTGKHKRLDSPFRFNLPALTYLSPELITTIKVCERDALGRANTALLDTAELSKKSDIFAFGTLLFELFEERFPFGEPFNSNNRSPCPQMVLFGSSTPLGFAANSSQSKCANINLSANELIYQIGSGQIGSKNLLNHDDGDYRLTLVNRIIAACWLKDPAERPNFTQLSFANDLGCQQDRDFF